ncbi:MAG: DinB family protein [Candidatus Hodarchaeales archaeon]
MNSNESITIIRGALIEQYGAALKTLSILIEKCPNSLWESESYGPPFYKIIYHILYFVDCYLSRTKEERAAFKPRFDFAEDFSISKENFGSIYWKKELTKDECILYISEMRAKAQKFFDEISLNELTSEPIFEWHGSSLLGSLIYNIRHIMLHIGALQSRLRMNDVDEHFWVSKSLLVI